MKIPKKIRINGFDWPVEENDKITNQGGGLFGSTHYRNQRIFLEPTETQQKKEQCLIHEIIHAIFWQTGLVERFKEVKGITEEEIVQALSFGIYQVLKENKLLK